jgi:hypothetical protein
MSGHIQNWSDISVTLQQCHVLAAATSVSKADKDIHQEEEKLLFLVGSSIPSYWRHLNTGHHQV